MDFAAARKALRPAACAHRPCRTRPLTPRDFGPQVSQKRHPKFFRQIKRLPDPRTTPSHPGFSRRSQIGAVDSSKNISVLSTGGYLCRPGPPHKVFGTGIDNGIGSRAPFCAVGITDDPHLPVGKNMPVISAAMRTPTKKTPAAHTVILMLRRPSRSAESPSTDSRTRGSVT